jgi:hypothetical protein
VLAHPAFVGGVGQQVFGQGAVQVEQGVAVKPTLSMLPTKNSMAALWFKIIWVSMAGLPLAAVPCSISLRVSRRE